jgi:hypothetical protein
VAVAVVLATTRMQRMFLVVLAVLDLLRDKTVQLQPQAPEIKAVLAVLILVVVAGLQIDQQMAAVQAVQVLLF